MAQSAALILLKPPFNMDLAQSDASTMGITFIQAAVSF